MTNLSINLNYSDQIPVDTIDTFYQQNELIYTLTLCLNTMFAKNTVRYPYFLNLDKKDWKKGIELDIYVTGLEEGRQLNHDARGKDYATNILSYPSDLPLDVLKILPIIPLGELVICHQVVAKQANEQGKTVRNHLMHLLVHGTLHLLGFDHELGEDERMAMESFEIEILDGLGIMNPYE